MFGSPRGLAGKLGGLFMARLNAPQERMAVEASGAGPGSRVLVVGHGPGVGLVLLGDLVPPDGRIVGVDPSAAMREMAAALCHKPIAQGRLVLRDGDAGRTGCADASMDIAISVNNVMLWDRPAGFAELLRVLRPGGRLVISLHRHVLAVSPEGLRAETQAAGFEVTDVRVRPRRFGGPAVELVARRPESPA